MQFHDIKRHTKRKKSRQVARGGKRGKTAGRGTKGQKARAGRKLRPEMRDIIKKIPKLRGYFFKSVQVKAIPVSLSQIEKNFENGNEITPKTLIEKKVISTYKGKIPRIKILSPKKDQSFSKKVSVKGIAVSIGAKTLIEKAGGSIS